MGIDPARLGGPIVGIASTWTRTMPCNLNHRELAAQVAQGVGEAGGLPLEFNTIAVFEGETRVGAVGVSGLPGAEDERLAQAAIDATA